LFDLLAAYSLVMSSEEVDCFSIRGYGRI